MQCPVCDERLRPVEKFGVEIDICPGCKGVWLDRGELGKLLAMDRGEASAESPFQPHREDRQPDHRREDGVHDDHGRDRPHQDRGRYHGESHGPRRRGSWLGDILGTFGEGGDD